VGAGDRIRTGECDFYFLLPSEASGVTATQPPRNGVACSEGAQEPGQAADGIPSSRDVHNASMRAEFPAAVLQSPVDHMQSLLEAQAHAAGQDRSFPMQVV
jgi:hypothetical protein